MQISYRRWSTCWKQKAADDEKLRKKKRALSQPTAHTQLPHRSKVAAECERAQHEEQAVLDLAETDTILGSTEQLSNTKQQGILMQQAGPRPLTAWQKPAVAQAARQFQADSEPVVAHPDARNRQRVTFELSY